MTNPDHLAALGNTNTQYAYDGPAPELLETFAAPRHTQAIVIDVPEFTSLCPKTGQPDWARIVIGYVPDKLCVESKSIKLYLGSFRNHGAFHEAVVEQIAKDLIDLLDPQYLTVEGRFTPRGGIPFWPNTIYRKSKDSAWLRPYVRVLERRMDSIPNQPR